MLHRRVVLKSGKVRVNKVIAPQNVQAPQTAQGAQTPHPDFWEAFPQAVSLEPSIPLPQLVTSESAHPSDLSG